MAVRYEHTQIGYVILGTVLGVGLIAMLPTVLVVDSSPSFGFWLAVGAIGIGLALFNSLTVRIEDDTLIWYFGPQFWRNTLPLSSIERIDTVRNSPWYGWGIRMLKNGWLYNVSGLDAVEIETNDGDVIRIGTDEPDRLARALRETARVEPA